MPELRFPGDFVVRRGRRAVRLPPSGKTRAALAHLCLQPRRFSREPLCQRLREVPDDPRGSVRRSLSKWWNLLADQARSRVLGDRGSVGVETEGVSIDMLELRPLVERALAKVPTAVLEAAAARYRGNVVEGREFLNLRDDRSAPRARRRVRAPRVAGGGHRGRAGLRVPLTRSLTEAERPGGAERQRSKVKRSAGEPNRPPALESTWTCTFDDCR